MSSDKIRFEMELSTHKRLKLLSLVENRPMEKIINELVKSKYGEKKEAIEKLIENANSTTKIKE
ncbi:MAG: hypothetical protein PF689_04515 [Deltaproteobacteria bacterium]|jgi:hypothetical protein|nr:hypothetical protein [Deltaproteobacteria bacterium]